MLAEGIGGGPAVGHGEKQWRCTHEPMSGSQSTKGLPSSTWRKLWHCAIAVAAIQAAYTRYFFFVSCALVGISCRRSRSFR